MLTERVLKIGFPPRGYVSLLLVAGAIGNTAGCGTPPYGHGLGEPVPPGISTTDTPDWAISEKAAEVTGALQVLYIDDFENNHGEQRYFVHDKQQGKRFELEFQGKPPKDATTGSFVRVRGKAINNTILMEANGTNSFETLAAASVTGPEDHNTIVLVTNFNDAAVPCPKQDIEEIMFTDPGYQSVNDLYREMSLNRMQFTGMVSEPFTIDYSSTDTCDVHAWADAADRQAEASGIDLTQYDHRIYVLPKKNGCGGYGVGTLGGSPSKTWIMQCDMKDVYAHELGHNLGMGHSGDITGQYMDASDIMGLSGVGLRQLNGPHQEQMGWRDAQQIIEITSDGVYDVAPLELDDASSAQIFKIRKPDTAEWYYLSYRQPIGFDASLSIRYLTGLSIHQHEGNGSTVKTTWLDTLTDSELFSDPLNGLTITQNYHDDYSVSFSVTVTTKCVRNNPTTNLTPSSQTDLAGATMSYALSITNNDTAECSDSNWNLVTQIPENWFGALSASEVTIVPGSSTTINWQVTSSDSAIDYTYALTMDLLNADRADKSLSASYTVATPEETQTLAPPTGMTASERHRDIVLNWDASDNNAIVGYRIYRNGSEIATTASTSFTDRRAIGHGYGYYARAFNADNNLSEPSVTVYTEGPVDTGEKTNSGKKRR